MNGWKRWLEGALAFGAMMWVLLGFVAVACAFVSLSTTADVAPSIVALWGFLGLTPVVAVYFVLDEVVQLWGDRASTKEGGV